jgi:general secretion pathway protein E
MADLAGSALLQRARSQRGHLTRGLTDELARLDGAGAKDAEGKEIGLAEILLRDAVRERATDIHLDPQAGGVRVRFRVDGTLLDATVLRTDQGVRLVRHLKAACGMDLANPFKPSNARMALALDGREVDLRVATAPAVTGEKLSVRLLDRSRVGQHLDELGLSYEHRQGIERWLADICGMFLVAGPTGNGKTTTLYALLHELRLHERSVITVEDPVEYQVDGVTQIQVDRRHGLTFDAGLRAALRLDPDYLLLGEVRESPDARAAVEASGTGRVLMSTIHSPDAVGTVTALRNLGLADHEIATSLRLVVAQRLVRRLCRRCCRREPLSDADRRWIASAGLPAAAGEAWVPVGCDACRHLGYDGRIGIFEVWQLNGGDYDRILAHADERTLRSHAVAGGLRTLLEDGYAKAAQGVTSLAALRSVSSAYPPSAAPANPATSA